MGKFDKFDSDDDRDGNTVTRKIRKLQDLGVLDKPSDEPGAIGGTTTITTYPFVQMKSGGRIKQLLKRLKKS